MGRASAFIRRDERAWCVCAVVVVVATSCESERAVCHHDGSSEREGVPQAEPHRHVPAQGHLQEEGRGEGWLSLLQERGPGIQDAPRGFEGTYIDKKCPFTGNVAIRGRILSGIVKSTKMNRTIIVRRDYFHFIKKYQRYEKRHKNLAAHISPAFRCKEGDTVIVGQCRPLSKTVRFNVLKVVPAGSKKVKGFSSY